MCPGKESTWEIQSFHIMSSDAESECESGGEGSSGGSKGGSGLPEISVLLAEARKAAVQVCLVACMCIHAGDVVITVKNGVLMKHLCVGVFH